MGLPNDSAVHVRVCTKLNLEIIDMDCNSGPYRWYKAELPEPGRFELEEVLMIPRGSVIPDDFFQKNPGHDHLAIEEYCPDTKNPYNKGLNHGYCIDAVPYIEQRVSNLLTKDVSLFIGGVWTEEFESTGFGGSLPFSEAFLKGNKDLDGQNQNPNPWW